MKQISVSNDIIPVGEFKTNIAKWLKSVRNTGQPIVITQNGKPAGVLLSPAEYDELVYKKLFVDSVSKGLTDAESGNVHTTAEVQEQLKKRRQRRNSM